MVVVGVLLVLVVGSSARGPGQLLGPHPVTTAASGDVTGLVEPRAGATALSVAVVEPGQRVRLLRAEYEPVSRWLSNLLVTVLLLVGAVAWGRHPVRRRVLELSIRALTEWWRPAPGRRAPPAASTS